MEFVDLKKASDAIDAGVWVDNIPSLPGIRLKVRALNSPIVLKEFGRAMRRAPRDENGVVAADLIETIQDEINAEFALLDWEGFTDDGEPIEYKSEVAAKWFSATLFRQGFDYAAGKTVAEEAKLVEGLRKN